MTLFSITMGPHDVPFHGVTDDPAYEHVHRASGPFLPVEQTSRRRIISHGTRQGV